MSSYVYLVLLFGNALASLNDSNRLHMNLFTHYNKALRPLNNETETLTVLIDFDVVSIFELNEVEQSITINARFDFVWIDESLKWNPGDYNGKDHITVPQNEIWLPDIFLVNTMNVRGDLGFDAMRVYVNHSGAVYWTPGDLYTVSCPMTVQKFPFDEQICEMTVSTWTSYHDEVNFKVNRIWLDRFVPHALWELASLLDDVTFNSITEQPEARFSLHLRRLPEYFVLNVIIPISLLSLINLMVFLLPVESGEKMGFSITILLAFVVFLTLLGNQLPTTSLHTPYITLYIACLIALSCLSLVATVLILRIHHRPETSPVPRLLTALVRCMKCEGSYSCLRRSKSGGTKAIPLGSKNNKISDVSTEGSDFTKHEVERSQLNTKNSSDFEGSSPDISWPDVARSLDKLFFFTFTLAAVTAAVVFYSLSLSRNK